MESAAAAVVKKKPAVARLWMSMDRRGQSELIECDKSVIMNRASIPARDLRILGPIFSNSSTIIARKRAIIFNLEFIRAIVTAEEVLLLDPLRQEVLPFVDQLSRKLQQTSSFKHVMDRSEGGVQDELPFEFQVLEIAVEFVCMFLEFSFAELERNACPALDELAKSASTENLKHIRSLKSVLTGLLARVQKVRNEIEHLLDDDEDLAQLCLTQRLILSQQLEASLLAPVSNSIVPASAQLPRINSARTDSTLAFNYHNDPGDLEDLEMLLEAYFVRLDGARNKILSLREYIADTEAYLKIQQDSKRNEMIELKLKIDMGSFSVAVYTLAVGIFGMNIPCIWYNINGIFWPVVGVMTAASILIFWVLWLYARWKKVIGY